MATVLIVDDADVVRITLRQILVKNGYDVVGEAEDGRTAIQLCQELKPDIVTMDITMPGMNGITTIQKIKEQCAHPCRIVVVSAIGHVQYLREAVAVGAACFIVKPYTEELVVKTLRTVLEEA